MRDQPPAVAGLGLKPAAAEQDVRPDGEGAGLEPSVGTLRAAAGVDTHTAQIRSKPRLEVLPDRLRQGLPAAPFASGEPQGRAPPGMPGEDIARSARLSASLSAGSSGRPPCGRRKSGAPPGRPSRPWQAAPAPPPTRAAGSCSPRACGRGRPAWLTPATARLSSRGICLPSLRYSATSPRRTSACFDRALLAASQDRGGQHDVADVAAGQVGQARRAG